MINIKNVRSDSLKENKKIIVVVVIILICICGIIIFNIVDKEHNNENEIINNISEGQNTEKEELSELENDMTNAIDNNKVVDNGIITSIENNVITIQNAEIDYPYQINIDNETKLTNYRTNEDISISEIKIGDYYDAGKIVRNISGDEWKKECIKNLAYCYKEGILSCNPQEITNIQNMGDYVIITLIMGDSATEYFNGRDNISTFELKAIAYPNLNIPTSSGNVNVYNLKEEVTGFMFWIGLDKDTINNEYPVISDIEIYDK